MVCLPEIVCLPLFEMCALVKEQLKISQFNIQEGNARQ